MTGYRMGRGDGIQGDDATARREGAEEIAEKGKD